MTKATINYRALKNSSVPTWLGLVLGSWVGLVWGSLLTAPLGVGIGVAAGSALGGFLAVPLWGTFFGFASLGRQRDKAVREPGVQQLEDDDPVTRRVTLLSARLGLKRRPWVAVMPHNNACAIGSGPNNALVVIGQPLLDSLTEKEVDAVIGHELGHIANNDMRRMGLAHAFQNSLVWYLGFSGALQRGARWILTWLSELFVLRLSRRREYWADAIGAALTDKDHMIAALEKLHKAPTLSRFERERARLMFRGLAGGSLLSTHPTLKQRRAALRAEIYLKRIPVLRAKTLPEPPSGTELPEAEHIAYAKP